MLVIEERIQDVQIMTISGRFDHSNEIALNTALDRAEANKLRHVVFNLERVSSIDSAGIGKILITFYRLRQKGIALSLVHPRGEVQELLNLTGISRLIPIFDVNNEALP